MGKKLFLIDYDDTLAPNLHDYTPSMLKFVEYVVEKMGAKAPQVPTIIRELDRIANENINAIDPITGNPYLYSARRFPTTLVDTFNYIAAGVKIRGDPFQVTDTHRADVWKIGEFAFDGERYKRQGLFPGVPETLDYLASTGDELKLLTKGEEWVQLRKIEATNVRKWFNDNVQIVPKKDEQVLLAAKGTYDIKRVWHIGNSIKSDVIPASKAGIGMIYVPLETWSHEMDHGGMPDYGRLIVAQEFSYIKELYQTLDTK